MNLQTFNFEEQKIRNINYKIENQIDSVLSKTNHIFGYVNPNSNIEDKISHLINTNVLLFDQNKKLTNENSSLKIHKGKNIVSPNRKIHKLKTTLHNISARISFLEGFHAAKKQ
jgi:predicted RNase H-like nuclease (RuvC/YqgF family)